METGRSSAEAADIGYIIRYNADMNWKMDHYHFHDMYEIYFSLSGDASFFVGDAIYDVHKGSVFVFNNMDLHRSISVSDKSYERFVLHFDPEYIADLCTPRTGLLDCFINRSQAFSHGLVLTQEQSGKLTSLFKKGEFYCNNEVFGQEIHQKIAIAEILLFVNELFNVSTLTYPSKNNKEFERILPILQYIQSNIHGDLSLNRLSARFYINKYYLETVFKRATGFSVVEYIIYRRVLKAKELLKKKLTVQQVGEMVGFNNNSHFIRTFKKLVGLPPKKYANQYEKGCRPLYPATYSNR